MIRIKRFILIAFLAVIYINGSAQNSQVMYYMRIPQNHLINPAIKPANLFYIGLPVLTGVNAGINNNFLNLNNLLQNDTISSWPPPDFDLNKLAGSLKENNTIAADANIQLLGLGFMIGKDLNIFINVIDRVEAKAYFPKNIMDLYITGYDQFLNKTINLSDLNIRAQYFREVGIGFSKNVTQKLRVGVKAKILFGVASLNFDNRLLSLKVNSDFTQTITADASLDISGKQRINTLKDDFSSGGKIGRFFKDYLKTPFSNPGLGIDLGAVYDINKMFSVSAAVTDLGYINWKDDLKSYKANNTFVFQGLSLKDVVEQNVSIDSLIKGIVDTVKKSFIENPNPLAYKTNLPAGVVLGANLNLYSVLSFGVLSQSKIYAGQIKEALTLSANAYLGRVFSASLSYTMANYSYNNFGFGMAFKAGPGQIYLIADKIPVKWSKIYIEKNNNEYFHIPVPENWNTMSLQVGFNISFGKIVRTKVDKPMVIVE
jgi:hypothetical protein